MKLATIRSGFGVLGVLLISTTIHAQPNDNRVRNPWVVGVNLEGILGSPTSSFTELPGVPNCLGSVASTARFEGGSGGGFSVSALLGLVPEIDQTFMSHLGGTMKIGFASTTTTFEADEQIGHSSDRSGTIVPIIDRYTVKIAGSELRVEPAIDYRMSEAMPLTISLGVRVGYMFGATYDQSESIVSPSNAEFTDGTTTRNQNNGDVAEISPSQIGMTLGLGYDIALSPRFSLRPSISGVLALTSPIPDTEWKGHELRLGLAILYNPPAGLSNPLENR